eukprot:6801745-Pyramimonas_sp.AAC.1
MRSQGRPARGGGPGRKTLRPRECSMGRRCRGRLPASGSRADPERRLSRLTGSALHKANAMARRGRRRARPERDAPGILIRNLEVTDGHSQIRHRLPTST